MSRIVRVQLARLIREEASVVVQVPDEYDNLNLEVPDASATHVIDELSKLVFEEHEEDLTWTPDFEWGTEAGTHQVFASDSDEPELILREEDHGSVLEVVEFRQPPLFVDEEDEG